MLSAGNQRRRRNSLRHPQFDYTSPGAYFVTICVAHRECLLGEVVDRNVQLTALGQIADATWPALLKRNPHVQLDEYMVMPNHVHALIWLRQSSVQATTAAVKQRAFADCVGGSLSVLVGAYKSSVTQQARAKRLLTAPALWQRNFYDNIVRNEEALAHIRNYIRTNPARWTNDQLHPAAPPNPFNRPYTPTTWRSLPATHFPLPAPIT
jgi:REP element-mobilizing transposase RayT